MKKQVGDIVVSAPKSNVYKKYKIQLLAASLIAVGIFAYLLYYISYSNSHKTPSTDANVNATIKETEVLASQKKYAEEAQSMKDVYDSSSSTEAKQVALLRMAAAYANDKQYDKAIQTYQQVIDTYPDIKIAGVRGLALLYMKRGEEGSGVADLQKALSYFNQAIELEQKNDAYASYIGSDRSNVVYVEGLIQNAKN